MATLLSVISKGLHAPSDHAVSPTAWFQDAIRRMETWLSWRHYYHSSVEELSALSDRELDDIGIARYDIRRIARESADMAITRQR